MSELQKKRYENIDFMKGICILLVIANHLDHLDLPLLSFSGFSLFRMPLYYFLSGIFFSRYDGPRTFLIKKTNNLIIPYIFFSVLTIISIFTFYVRRDYTLHEAIIESEPLHNAPLWFLISLFEVGVLMYFISGIKRLELQGIIVTLLSLVGYYFCEIGLNLPFYLNTAFCGIIFYYAGFLLRKCNVLNDTSHIHLKFVTTLVSFLLIAFWILPDKRLNMSTCDIPFAFHWFVLAGLSGTLALFYFSKIVEKISIINYIGRYSIIVLGVHWYFVKSWKYLVSPTDVMPKWLFLYIVFIFAVIASLVCIVVLKKYLPWFTAQKPLIKI